MKSSDDLNNLLTNLETLTLDQLASHLQAIGPDLEQDDWSAILYTLEEMATTGQGEQALALMQSCLGYARQIENGWLERAAQDFLGHIYRHQGQVEQAVDCYQAVAEAGQAVGDEASLTQAALALGHLARARMAQGRISEAITTLQETLALNDRTEDRTAQVADRLTLANLYLVQENFAEAEAVAGEALRRAEAVGNPLLVSLAWSGLGEIKADVGDNALALERYQYALETLEAIDEPDDLELWLKTLQNTLVSLAMAKEALGHYEQAMADYAEAARTAYDLDNRREQATIITWLGTAQLTADRPAQALRSFRAALRLADTSGDLWRQGYIYFHQAAAFQALERWAEAEESVQRALAGHAAAPGEHSVDEAACRIKLGEIARDQGQFERAIDQYRQALAGLTGVDVGAVERLIYARLGEAYWHLSDWPRAYDTLRQALTVYEGKRRTVTSLLDRIDFAPSREGVYAYLTRTCLALSQRVEAFQVVEQGRARVFREQLAERWGDLDLDEALDWSQTITVLSGEEF